MSDAEKIDLLKGAPGADLVPSALLQRAAKEALSQRDIGLARGPLDYGDDAGYHPFRESLANWLSQFYRLSSTSAANLCITGGASQNLACILQVYADLGVTQRIWLVEPVYFLAVRMFEDAGFQSRICAVPENQSGIDIEHLRKAIAGISEESREPTKPRRSYSKTYKHILYCVPTFSNPSGKTMPLQTRQELVRLARQHDLLVICDDVYDFLQWPRDDPIEAAGQWTSQLPRLVDVDASLDGGPPDGFGNVVSNGSFSKIIAPGVRVGWAQGTEKFAEGLSQAGSSRSGGAPSQMTSSFVNVMIKDGSLSKHITEHLIPAYRRRHQISLQAAQRHLLPIGFTVDHPSRDISHDGGYFLWLQLPPDLCADDVAEAAVARYNLNVGRGHLFEVPTTTARTFETHKYLRLCFAWEEESKLEQGVVRLAQAVRDLTAGGRVL